MLNTIYGKLPIISCRNAAVGTTAELVSNVGADVNQYNLFDRETTVSISSSSTDDVMTSGTGAWTVKVDGIDRTGAAATETLELNGQTAVVSTETYMRVTALTVVSAGSGGVSAGDIYVIRTGESTLSSGVPATKAAIQAIILAGDDTEAAGYLGISSSDDDDKAGDTGATEVTVYGMDIYFRPQSEVFATNGQTMVVGTKIFRRVHCVKVTAAGSSRVNEGDIYVYPSASVALSSGVPAALTAVVGKIATLTGIAYSGIYTLPPNTQMKIKGILLGVSGAAGTLYVQQRNLATGALVSSGASEIITSVPFDAFTTAPTWIDLSQWPAIRSAADIELRALSASSAAISAQMFLEKTSGSQYY